MACVGATRLAHVSAAEAIRTHELLERVWRSSMQLWQALADHGHHTSPSNVLGGLRHLRELGVAESGPSGWRAAPEPTQAALPLEAASP